MLIIGCDYHPSVQQIAFVDLETGETGERQLLHKDGEAERFYRDLKLRGISVRVGIEATGHARWFERLLAELGFELWIGDPAQIKAARVRKQKTDRQDAQLLLKLLVEEPSHASGYQVRRIGMCANCFGIGIGWCRCGHES
jgi:transposase